MSSAVTVEQEQVEAFFEKWLPSAFARLSAKEPGKALADCSLVAEIGPTAFTLSVQAGQLSVERASRPSCTFRIRASLQAFTRLMPTLEQLGEAEERLGHFLRLDAETVRLVSAVPGALKVSVKDGPDTWDVVLGPGNADLSAARCSVTCQYADFQQLRTQRTSPMDLFMNGKLLLDGDLEIALALGGLLMN